MTKAIILAAGQGTRLRPLTDARPKCLVELAGKSLLDWQLGVLRAAGIEDIVLVGGYRADALRGRGCRIVLNKEFAVTNMVFTLFRAREVMDDSSDMIIAYGDIIYEPLVLEKLLQCQAPIGVTVDRLWHRYWSLRMAAPLEDAETLKMGPENQLLEVGKKPSSLDEIHAQYMGLLKVRADWVPKFVGAYDDLDRDQTYDGKTFRNMFMTSFLQHLIDTRWDVRAVPVDGGWLEADTPDDIDLYERLASEGRLGMLCRLEHMKR